jgi:20S proteasome alpha/beta subunit
MTIITGIVCRDGIVFGSDSQGTSNRGVDCKRLNETKVYLLDEGLMFKVLVGGSGAVSYISKAIENTYEIAKKNNIDSLSALIEVFEDVMTQLTKRYIVDKRKQFYDNKLPEKDFLKEYEEDELPNVSAYLLVGGQNKEKKYAIYVIYPEGIGEKEEGFGTLGSGSAYAEYLMGEFYDKDMDCEQGKLLTTYIIEEVKKIDPNVGGVVQLAVLKEGGASIISPENCLKVCLKAQKINLAMKKTWKGLI